MTAIAARTQIILPISVVIATLGGRVLMDTISQLNRGDGIPAEILICIPEEVASNADCVGKIENVHVVKTACRGQVAQRAIGLSTAAYSYVMQFDDDVTLLPDALKVMFEILISKGPGNIVAPFFRIKPDGQDGTIYTETFSGFLRDLHATLVCGARFGRKRLGCISAAGIAYGVPMSNGVERVVESQWLPGGVALCHKSDLILTDYYPYLGKAFSEDLIHSILWRQQGCRLWTVLDVSALIEVTVESFDYKNALMRFRAHAYVAKLVGGSLWRTRLWFACYCLINLRRILRASLNRNK